MKWLDSRRPTSPIFGKLYQTCLECLVTKSGSLEGGGVGHWRQGLDTSLSSWSLRSLKSWVRFKLITPQTEHSPWPRVAAPKCETVRLGVLGRGKLGLF